MSLNERRLLVEIRTARKDRSIHSVRSYSHPGIFAVVLPCVCYESCIDNLIINININSNFLLFQSCALNCFYHIGAVRKV